MRLGLWTWALGGCYRQPALSRANNPVKETQDGIGERTWEKRAFRDLLKTKANSRRGQRARMLSRSRFRLVLITALKVATGPASVNSLKSARAPFVRYWHEADIPSCTAHVRFWG